MGMGMWHGWNMKYGNGNVVWDCGMGSHKEAHLTATVNVVFVGSMW